MNKEVTIDIENPKGNDLISREDALMALTGEWTEITDEIIHRFIKRIKALPSVNPQKMIGHWIAHPKGIYAHLICDKCLSNAPYDCRTNYCPNCGCRMVEPQETKQPEISSYYGLRSYVRERSDKE